MGSQFFWRKKKNPSKENLKPSNMLFITIVALVNVCLAFNVTVEEAGIDRTLCCATAKQQCGDKCSARLCKETCEATCGLFSTNCGSWVCQDIAGFSCTATTTQAPITAAACKASGEVCLSTAGDMSTCCSGAADCTDLTAVTTVGVKCA